MVFIDLEKAYNRVNSEALWQVMKMYDVRDKLLGGIKSIYVHSSACVRVKWGESERYRGVSCPLCCPMYIWME